MALLGRKVKITVLSGAKFIIQPCRLCLYLNPGQCLQSLFLTMWDDYKVICSKVSCCALPYTKCLQLAQFVYVRRCGYVYVLMLGMGISIRLLK